MKSVIKQTETDFTVCFHFTCNSESSCQFQIKLFSPHQFSVTFTDLKDNLNYKNKIQVVIKLTLFLFADILMDYCFNHSSTFWPCLSVCVSSPRVVQAWAAGPWARGSTAWSSWSYSASSGHQSASSLQAGSNASLA